MGLSIIYYYYDHPPYGDGGLATNAILDYPGGVSVDASGGLFIADSGHGRVRKVVMGGPVLSLSDVTTNNAGVYDVVVTVSLRHQLVHVESNHLFMGVSENRFRLLI